MGAAMSAIGGGAGGSAAGGAASGAATGAAGASAAGAAAGGSTGAGLLSALGQGLMAGGTGDPMASPAMQDMVAKRMQADGTNKDSSGAIMLQALQNLQSLR